MVNIAETPWQAAFEQSREANHLNELWWHGTSPQWDEAEKHYWELVKPDHLKVEERFEHINMEQIADYTADEFFNFLYDEYFFWKYTARNRLATTRAQLIRYQTENRMNELAIILEELINLDRHDTVRGLEIAKQIRGLGTAGASGLLAILLPQYFGTVDQFVVKALCSIKKLPEHPLIIRMHPESISIQNACIINGIMIEKAKCLNTQFHTERWTPRMIDKILWSAREQ